MLEGPMKHVVSPLGMFALAVASFLTVMLGWKLGIAILVACGAALLVVSVLTGGVLIVVGIVRTLRKRV
jgi:hypothetical protein